MTKPPFEWPQDRPLTGDEAELYLRHPERFNGVSKIDAHTDAMVAGWEPNGGTIIENAPLIPSTSTVPTKGLSPILWTDLASLDDRKVILLQEGALLPTLAGVEAAIMADEDAATLFRWGACWPI
jgi:hypothetical protein